MAEKGKLADDEPFQALSLIDEVINEAMTTLSRSPVKAPKLEVPKRPKTRPVASRYMQSNSTPSTVQTMDQQARLTPDTVQPKATSRLTMPSVKKLPASNVSNDQPAQNSRKSVSSISKIQHVSAKHSKPSSLKPKSANASPTKPPLPRGSSPERSRSPSANHRPPSSLVPSTSSLNSNSKFSSSSLSSPTKSESLGQHLSSPSRRQHSISPYRDRQPKSPSTNQNSVPASKSPGQRQPARPDPNTKSTVRSRSTSGPLDFKFNESGQKSRRATSFSGPLSPEPSGRARVLTRTNSDVSPMGKIQIEGEKREIRRPRVQEKSRNVEGLSPQEWETICMVLYNRELQWKFVKQKFLEASKKREMDAERQIWVAIQNLHNLRGQVAEREKTAKQLILAHKMQNFLNLQKQSLLEFSNIREEFEKNSSSILKAMHQSTAKVPLVRGIKVEAENFHQSLKLVAQNLEKCSQEASGVLPTSVETSENVTQLAEIALELQETVQKCNDGLTQLNHKQLHERSLRGHLIQLAREQRKHSN